MSDCAERKKLYWRCRRGTRELDRIVLTYLELEYDQADPACQKTFAHLLEMPDPELYRILMQDEEHDDHAVASIQRCVRQQVPRHSREG